MTERKDAPCPTTKGPHLPRFPVSYLNQMVGYRYECAYCGKGCDGQGSAR